ncbi:hypothetical protein A2195_00930 [Candidatus Shapirobacteria bacterium RIFOXYA1_FULL_39_17]|nr:MAG: hypothetical protein A2195_00930 [Candidatus Shapirobacteria bacterium RIFOXYA1_FULL_39_17]
MKNNKNMQITVIVHPNSKNPRIEKDMFHTLHVYVTAPPLEGKANKKVIFLCCEGGSQKIRCLK